MKFRTIASEWTNPFYLKLKRPYFEIWYFDRLISLNENKKIIPKNDLKKEFKIDQIAFFKKHMWGHFISFQNSGWILLKFFRKNYCRLAMPRIEISGITNCFWITVLMLYGYKKQSDNFSKIIHLIHAKYSILAKYPHDFSQFLIKKVGTFKNVSYKSTRRIRDQIMRQRPVILWVKGLHSYTRNCQAIIIVGFNRRLFLFFDPLDRKDLKVITQMQLLKVWRKANYQGISC